MGGNCKQGLGQFSYTPFSKPPPMGENCKQGLLLIINIPFYSPLPFGGGAGGEGRYFASIAWQAVMATIL